MEEKIRNGYLYDFYGELLNAHQQEIYEKYVLEDLSLSEIADDEGISRQAVHDLIKRCTRTLESYEERLHLLSKFMDIREQVEAMRSLLDEVKDTSDTDVWKSIGQFCDRILEDL